VRYEFATAEPPKVHVAIPTGRVEVETGESDQTLVEVEALRGDADNVRVEQRGREITVAARRKGLGFLRGEEYEVRIRAPHRAELEVETASADLAVHGVLASLDAKSASGDVAAQDVEGDVVVRSASGDVVAKHVGGRLDVNTASGDVQVRSAAGGASVHSASGDVVVGDAGGRVSVNTASGDQTIESIEQGSADLKSMSGDVKVGIKQGSRLRVDARSMSGETSSELELFGTETETEGPLVELRAATMSGDIRIIRA
jgi:DUF4097 and DUF4098 domain-containing protein YvlB